MVAIVNLLLRYLIDIRAVNEVEGIDLDEVVAQIQAEHPDVEVEEAVAIAADRAEAMLAAQEASAVVQAEGVVETRDEAEAVAQGATQPGGRAADG